MPRYRTGRCPPKVHTRRGRALLVTWLLVAAAPAARPAVATSLWMDTKDLTADYRASQVGDQLTVLIVESSSGSNQAATKTEKETDAGLRAGPGLGGLDFIPLVSLNSKWESDHEGKGSSSRSNRVQAKITVGVTAVRRNGDLEIMGTRFVNMSDEHHEIRLTGVVRQRDVTADNTVLSTFIGDARVEYVGDGPILRSQKIGWWKRILDFVF